MKRLGRVVARSHHALTLQLIKAEKCIDCPANCNEPLVDLFALRKNHFTLSNNDPQYTLVDQNELLSKPQLLDQLVNIQIDSQDLMKSSSMLYLLPLVIILITMTLGHVLGRWANMSTDLTAGFGLLFGLLFIYLMSRINSPIKPLKFRPKVTIL